MITLGASGMAHAFAPLPLYQPIYIYEKGNLKKTNMFDVLKIYKCFSWPCYKVFLHVTYYLLVGGNSTTFIKQLV